jgi:hypothetical protein
MKAILVMVILVGLSACGPIHLEGAASLSVGHGQRIEKSLKSSIEHDEKGEVQSGVGTSPAF